MGVHSKLADDIEEVDIIIAGGKSIYLHIKILVG